MTKFISFVGFICIAVSTAAFAVPGSESVDLSYSGFNFKVPPGTMAIGSNGGKDNFLVLRYGKTKGKQYLAFTDMTSESSVLYGCKPVRFYSAAIGFSEPGDCNQVQIEGFRQVFLADEEKAVWQNGDMKIFYTVSSGMKYVFLITAKKIIKIDSDFLSEGQLGKVVFDYLN